MIFFLTLAAIIIWILAIAVRVLGDFPLLFRTTRWAATLYMGLVGVPLFLVYHEGLLVLGENEDFIKDSILLWTVWYMLIWASVIFWPFLFPPAIALVAALGTPWIQTVLNHGLATLGLVEFIHNPLWHLLKICWQLWMKSGEDGQQRNLGYIWNA